MGRVAQEDGLTPLVLVATAPAANKSDAGELD
jgi:hypothetical protein